MKLSRAVKTQVLKLRHTLSIFLLPARVIADDRAGVLLCRSGNVAAVLEGVAQICRAPVIRDQH